MMKEVIPAELVRVQELARRAIAPIKPAEETSEAPEGFLFSATRTNAGRTLPPQYLVYFLLAELLGFEDLGRSEKVAWSIPIDFQGTAYLIEYAKFGVGVFATPAERAEDAAGRIVSLIKRGVRAAQPFFRWLANNAVNASHFNVMNNGRHLFERYEYFRGMYQSLYAEAEARKDEVVVQEYELPGFATATRSYLVRHNWLKRPTGSPWRPSTHSSRGPSMSLSTWRYCRVASQRARRSAKSWRLSGVRSSRSRSTSATAR